MFFFQFLDAGDRWKEFLSDGPLDCIGNRGSGKLNVMGFLHAVQRGATGSRLWMPEDFAVDTPNFFWRLVILHRKLSFDFRANIISR